MKLRESQSFIDLSMWAIVLLTCFAICSLFNCCTHRAYVPEFTEQNIKDPLTEITDPIIFNTDTPCKDGSLYPEEQRNCRHQFPDTGFYAVIGCCTKCGLANYPCVCFRHAYDEKTNQCVYCKHKKT